MISGLYSAATAIDASNRRHEIASENIANLQVPGYRRRMISQVSFDAVMQPMQGMNSSTQPGTVPNNMQYDFMQGPIEETKLKLDVALNGEGFFSVQGPSGTLYTRSGAFHLNPQRVLVNVDGMPILGTGGPIQLPPGVTEGQLEITQDGNIYAGNQKVGQFALVQFADNSVLSAEGASLFSAPPGTVTTASAAVVLQGRLEMSNTTPVNELISIIAISRHRDAVQKALTTITDSIQKRIGLR